MAVYADYPSVKKNVKIWDFFQEKPAEPAHERATG